jgi:tyrocidine synthetase-3
LQRMEPDGKTYNMPNTMVLEGEISKARLEETFVKLIRRHESFRTSFTLLRGVPVQRIHRDAPFKVDYLIADPGEADQIVEHYSQPFDLSQAPILRVGLIKIGKKRFILMVEMHHIICDGTSLVLFVEDFMALYRGERLPRLRVRYRDFSEWRGSPGEREALAHQENYWLREFAGLIPGLNLPTDCARPLVREFAGARQGIVLEAQPWEQLKTLVMKEGVTLYMALLAIFNVLLAKLSGQEDLVVGTGVEGRRHDDLRKIIGMFINTLPLRNWPQKEKTFRQFLEEVKERTLAAFENQDYPFEDLVEKVVVRRDTARNPLFDVSFQVENIQGPAAAPASAGVKVLPHDHERKISRFDLTLRALETSTQLVLDIEYNTGLFNENTMTLFLRYFTRILAGVVAAPGKRLVEIEMIPVKAREELLFQLNEALEQEVKTLLNTPGKNPRQLLNTALPLLANHLALACGDRHLTYSELARRSAAVAGGIVRRGMKPQTLVGILMEDRVKLIISMLGVLNAGCVFVPLDLESPRDRLETMIRSLDPDYILGDKGELSPLGDRAGVEKHRPRFILMEELVRSGKGRAQKLSPTGGVQPGGEDPLYVYFTSGTTGTPRAMLGKNRGLSHFIDWEIETFAIGPHHRVSQLTHPTFDAFLRDIFVPLGAGGVICIPGTKEITREAHTLIRWLETSGIRLIHCVPSLFRLLASAPALTRHHFQALRYVLFSGEPIHPSDLVRWYELFGGRIQLVNLWGPSETTLAKTCHFIREPDLRRERIPVGQPLRGARLLVLDSRMQPCPERITGDIYILTPFSTSGYGNDPELTAQRFLANPFNPRPGARMHKTGDLGRLLPGGNLEVLGRNDRQVKIRGIRVELAEIENLLVRHGQVKEAVVLKQEISAGSEVLTAYVTVSGSPDAEKDRESLARELEGWLTAKLPLYMVPAAIMVLEKFPRTSRGKVDYGALPHPLAQQQARYTPPRDDLEKRLCSLWSDVLKLDLEKIGTNHRFFELGGNSLNIMSLVLKIHKEFDVRIPLGDIFNNSTIRQQAKLIKAAESDLHIPLKPAEEREYYPLSSAQMRVYILHQMRAENMIYNMPRVQVLEGAIDGPRLEAALIKLIERHESFRTSFLVVSGTPMQRVRRKVPFGLDYFSAGEEEAEAMVNGYLRPFDLSQAPILRVGLIKLGEARHILMVEMHHIVSDGTSLTVFVNDLLELYRGSGLPLLRIRYRDFSQWRNSPNERAILQRSEQFWLNQFPGEIPVLNLPTDFARPMLRRFGGDQIEFFLDVEVSGKLKALSIKEEATSYMVLLAVFNILLAKVCGQEDIIIGTGIEGRNHDDLRPIIGMFVNALCLRNYPEPHKTFSEFLREVKARALAAFENQDYQFEDLVEKVVANRNTGRNPLHDLTFQMENIESPAVGAAMLKVLPYSLEDKFSKFDLTLRAVEARDLLYFSVEYSTSLFREETIQRLMSYFRHLAAAVGRDPSSRLEALEIFPGEEKQRLLVHLNEDPDREIKTLAAKGYRTLQDRWQTSCGLYADQVAIAYGERNLTYAQLDRGSAAVAQGLIRRGIPRQTFIGIMAADRLLLITALLGVLEAGGVFIPLEPDLPPARLAMMIRSTNLRFILNDAVGFPPGWQSAAEENPEPEFIPLAEFSIPGKKVKRAKAPAVRCESRDQIYVYFTSGTTGTPRALVGQNRSLAHFIHWEIETFGLLPGDHTSQLINPDFDAFLRDVWVPLCSGGVVSIPPAKEILMDAEALVYWLQKTGIHLVHCVPSLFRLLNSLSLTAANLKDLKYILLSGERINPPDLVRWYDTFGERVQLVNLWGPTETTLVKSFYLIQPSDARGERVPVGKPMAGARVVCLDSGMKLCPPLVVGELYILTPFSTFGYCNEPELTRQKFITHPDLRLPGLNIYKTGDWGRLLADGNWELLGRNDRLVKIRGIRIELEEIESLLVGHPLVEEAVVVTRELTDANPVLCAYVVVLDSAEEEIGAELLVVQLESHLAGKLPAYMVPAIIMMVEAIPRTPRGKVDYNRLPDPFHEEKVKFVAPRDEMELQLAQIWTEVLKLEKIGVSNDFFEVGGNSLNIMAVLTKIHRDFQVKFTLPDIFNNPTIAEQAAFIREAKREKHISLPCVEEKEYYPLSSAQKRMFILHRMDPGGRVYNVTRVLVLEGAIQKERLEETFRRLIQRQESFRTSFALVEGKPVQRIHRQVRFAIDYMEAAAEKADEIVNGYLKPFDLSQAPILRVGLVKIGAERCILMVEMHHIISDGASMVLLVNDFMALHRGETPPCLRVRYKDFSGWRNSAGKRKHLENQERYWLNEFETVPPPLNLSSDYTRPAVLSFAGETLAFDIGSAETARLKALALKEGATLYMVLLAICYVLLSRLGGQEDIVIGTGIEGRHHEDLRQIIGMFVNTLALRNYPRQDKTFRQFLKEVRERTLKAFENQDYPFEDLVEKVVPHRDTNRNPLFDLDFQVENLEKAKPGASTLRIRDYGYRRKIARFDLTLRAFEVGDRLNFTLEYSTALFKEETIRWWMKCYQDIAAAVLEDPGIKLAGLGTLAREEEETLLPQLLENLEDE